MRERFAGLTVREWAALIAIAIWLAAMAVYAALRFLPEQHFVR